jgi:hypothetical protein
MTPSYLVVGTKRGGSTSIAHWISRHPEVAPCLLSKGTHYFDVNFHRGWNWYLSAFEPRGDGGRITGEASPYYMFHPLAMERIARALPDVRVIVSLREPIGRAWSHHQYEVQQGFEDKPFSQAIELEEERLRGEEDRIRANPRYESYAHRHYTYLQRGQYAEQLEHIFGLLPREQVLVVRSESMFTHPHRELERVWDHLGLTPVRLDGLDRHKATNVPLELPTAVHEQLEQYFRPWNERLQQLLGADFTWNE